PPDHLQRVVGRAVRLEDAGPSCRHHLVVAEATSLAARPDDGALLHDLARRGAVGLAVTGTADVAPTAAADWRGQAVDAGLALVLVATGDADRVVTQALGALLDQQSHLLERVDEAHQILVDIVLAGGGLEDLCERLAGFL